MSDASRILVTARASSVPRPPLEAGFSSHNSVVGSEKDGGGDVLVLAPEECFRQLIAVSQNGLAIFAAQYRALGQGRFT